MKLVPLTPRHIQIMAALPEEPDGTNLVGTACISDNGWPVACGGAYVTGKQAELFAHFTNVTRAYPITIGIIARGFLSHVHELGVEQVIAYPDPVPRSRQFLRWLGFRPNGIVTERGAQYAKWVSQESSRS